MSKVIAPTSIDAELEQLLREIDSGTAQLPEFQRGWIWDDTRIRAIIASISQGYPMGVIMRLAYGSASARFKYRPVEGAEDNETVPAFLILDGQQRLTSIYCAAYSDNPVVIHVDKDKFIKRFYYLDINGCLNVNTDRIDAVISVPESRKFRAGQDRSIQIDLSSRELEYQHEMFPLNIIFDSNAREDWADGYKEFHGNTSECKNKYKRFRSEVLDTITGYKLPVITLDKDTPKEAVCKVFENVNKGGVTLTVFELVTASFAADDFNLREDWEKCRDIITGADSTQKTDLMDDVDNVSFLTAITLYSSFMDSGVPTACKKEDVLNLSLDAYKNNREAVLDGYEMARKFLFSQCVFRKKDLPYSPQLTILAAICAVIGKGDFHKPKVQSILTRWFWCGVLGEMYGNMTYSLYVNDIEDVAAALSGKPSQNRTINKAFFSATRLMSLKTKLSAAYRGIMALLYREGCRDFISGTIMDVVKSMDETPDVHHIFPKSYCKGKYSLEKCDSIINKTPLLAASNRSIGKDAPSVYSARIMQSASIDSAEFRKRIESNLIDYESFIADDFNAYFIDRAKKLLRLIEQVMGKPVTDKDSQQTIELYGASLA